MRTFLKVLRGFKGLKVLTPVKGLKGLKGFKGLKVLTPVKGLKGLKGLLGLLGLEAGLKVPEMEYTPKKYLCPARAKNRPFDNKF